MKRVADLQNALLNFTAQILNNLKLYEKHT